MCGNNKILNLKNFCTGCGACMNICKHNCISMKNDEEGFLYPFIDQEKCIQCSLCEKICPILQSQEENSILENSENYMYKAGDLNILENSSSGGAFTLLANLVLQQNGIVFASKYNGSEERLENNDTDHFELNEFRKSKYIESNTLQVFRLIKRELQKDRWTLFCGTPCHVMGLINFLQNTNTSKLITIDFVCHGVPSNEHFTTYKKTLENRRKKITKVDFRYKDLAKKEFGWHNFNLHVSYCDGTQKLISRYESYYYKAFVDNNSLRRSCYTCNRFKISKADFTIADFWGINYYKNKLDDNRGISLISIHTLKGKEFIQSSINQNEFELLPSAAIDYLVTRKDLSAYWEIREKVMTQIKSQGYMQTLKNMYRKEIILYKTKKVIKKILHKNE